MIDRDGDKIIFSCDCCEIAPPTYDTVLILDDTKDAWNIAMNAGWRTVVNAHTHACPSCAKKLRQPVQPVEE
jgi:hypothetical protein